MAGDKLTRLQWDILNKLSGLEPPFTLTGGAALAGIHLGHRTTRDLDLFWRNREELGNLVDQVREQLSGMGLEVVSIQTAPSFHRFQVSRDEESCVVDLIAEPFGSLAPPVRARVAQGELLVDSQREILASKLGTLLSRSEIRDLEDVQVLLKSGENLEQGLKDAARKDRGFSPLTLAWVLRSLDVGRLARVANLPAEQSSDLEELRTQLIAKLLAIGNPEG